MMALFQLKRGVLFGLVWLMTTSVFAGPCKQCYVQKTTLFFHCGLNRSLFISEQRWCMKLFRQIHELQRFYKSADNLIKNRKKNTHLAVFYSDYKMSAKNKKLPYDDCDVCFNDIETLAYLCNLSSQKSTRYCQKVNLFADQFTGIIQDYPYVVAGPMVFERQP